MKPLEDINPFFDSLTTPISSPSTNHQLAIVADNLYHEVHEVGISVLERT